MDARPRTKLFGGPTRRSICLRANRFSHTQLEPTATKVQNLLLDVVLYLAARLLVYLVPVQPAEFPRICLICLASFRLPVPH